ncbi:hypothetical protein FWD20_04050 [Candidatus Saccharibacteria bacterium]|nr:hypothetical protein [Candidatus Saccharibacteria bacterium]
MIGTLLLALGATSSIEALRRTVIYTLVDPSQGNRRVGGGWESTRRGKEVITDENGNVTTLEVRKHRNGTREIFRETVGSGGNIIAQEYGTIEPSPKENSSLTEEE